MEDLDIENPVLRNISNMSGSEDSSNDSIFSKCKQTGYKIHSDSNSSDEDSAPVSWTKKRLQRLTDSESDSEKVNAQQNIHADTSNGSSTRDESTSNIFKNTSDSDDDTKTIKNKEQQLRMKNKRNKLRDKLKSLLTSRSKDVTKKGGDSDNEHNENSNANESNENCSINNIKQDIKKHQSMSFKPSICDPDTSDEEGVDYKREKLKTKSQNHRKKTIPTSPKPLRMSAKQAMENMKKIKSESNRLLREKEVTLPYHRPKAFSLKDIMSRRKPAMTADGKAFPIKMNEQQLRQYAQMLEERQKEIMDLCKSESDEEQDNSTDTNDKNESLINVNEATESLKKQENQLKDNMLVNEASCVHETPPEVSQSRVLDINCHNTSELGKSINMKLDAKSYLEDHKLPINSCLNKDSVESNLDKLNMDSEVDVGIIGKEITHEISTETESEMINLYLDSENTIGENLENIDNKIKDINIDTPIETNNVHNGNLQNMVVTEISVSENTEKIPTEPDSQGMILHFDSEKTIDDHFQIIDKNMKDVVLMTPMEGKNTQDNDFSDDEIDMLDIDKLIENAEIVNGVTSDVIGKSPILTKYPNHYLKPKIMGAPGMVIDLDDSESATKKLSGVELLKERFTYFAKLKTAEELEREREKTSKPGAQHLKLKQELQDIIAEQRSLEWAKRLNEEKQQQIELKALRGEESEAEDDISKIEALIDENEREDTSEGESEPEEDDLVEIKEKSRSKNPMIDDEAEESDCDNEVIGENQTDVMEPDNDVNALDEDNDVCDEEQSSEESSDDESEEDTTKARKRRILKAFEDSDDENANEVQKETSSNGPMANVIEEKCDSDKINVSVPEKVANVINKDREAGSEVGSQIFIDSQDDDIQLAQRMVSVSDDLFTSQESISVVPRNNSQDNDENALGTQTFSILNSISSAKDGLSNLESTQNMNFVSGTLSLGNLDAAMAPCSGNLTQNFIPSHLSSSQPPIDQSQAIGEDVLALCTGKFYDNQFISQSVENNQNSIEEAVNDDFDDSWSKGESQVTEKDTLVQGANNENNPKDRESKANNEAKDIDAPGKVTEKKPADSNLLQSIIDELHDDDKIDSLKPNKYFGNNTSETNNQLKKKFVIESDDEVNDDTCEKKKKKLKKKKLEQRALQISDDEQEESEETDEYLSEIENDPERIVEYDSEENEVEVKEQNPKKKRKVADFFENEAELTSEDEWVGSGDEDEAGLDRMEREEGDDETFHQGTLQRELGQIHMRDVLDQDKKEVRLIQELLFEDGDLGDGHRQRKFRWRNADGEEEPESMVDDLADTQEDEFESEEQWRKQRHEREVFLRQMKEQDKNEDIPNITLNRSTIIKANLLSKTMSSLLSEVNNSSTKTDKIENSTIKEKKDIPSPKKSFTILQHKYHNSLLSRGGGSLARLAALAAPLATDDSTKLATVAHKDQRNFVFTSVNDEPKVTKRKADSQLDTPRLVKKLKTNEKQTLTRNSLLDHLRI